jgi:hypothetical protein
MQQRPPPFGLNSAVLIPAMIAAAAALFWSQCGWIQPGAAADSTGMAAKNCVKSPNCHKMPAKTVKTLHKITAKMAKTLGRPGLNSAGLSPTMKNARPRWRDDLKQGQIEVRIRPARQPVLSNRRIRCTKLPPRWPKRWVWIKTTKI